MPRRVFVDTAYLVALLDPRDRLHASALRLTDEFEDEHAQLVTTDAVMTEFGNYFAKSPLRATAGDWVEALRRDGGWDVAAVTPALQRQGEARYRKHADKGWSVTDCISMELMLERKLREVATSDVHFEQAGFVVLLRQP